MILPLINDIVCIVEGYFGISFADIAVIQHTHLNAQEFVEKCIGDNLSSGQIGLRLFMERLNTFVPDYRATQLKWYFAEKLYYQHIRNYASEKYKQGCMVSTASWEELKMDTQFDWYCLAFSIMKGR